MGFKKLHTTSCINNTCSGNKRRKNKSMHSYSVMCDKNHSNNSIQGRNICEEVFKESYYVCVTKLKNDNKISVNVDGYSVCELLDTGSTTSTINLELYNTIKQTTKLVVNIYAKTMYLSRWFNNELRNDYFSASENRQNNIYSGSICFLRLIIFQ